MNVFLTEMGATASIEKDALNVDECKDFAGDKWTEDFQKRFDELVSVC